MLIIPAIDLKNGRCVRLKQGVFSDETVYSDRPAEVARMWVEKGAERLHIVDLDGALEGRPLNEDIIRDIVESAGVPVQLGGGIRDLETIETYFSLGIRFLILGTMAYRDPDLFRSACERFPGKIILAIDARNNEVAIQGWTEATRMSPIEMAAHYEGFPISAVIYTDIGRDGMETGPNIEATRRLAESTHIPVIISGGISGQGDIKKVLPLRRYGVIGVITGRALYEGKLGLEQAVRLARDVEKGM
ncbi:MAG: 1-(5-phosphoribosyl)-5-[(5-phosphoribosylamino)methylideneamino]imidazole-4-carboxamide isomerase [Deltaproteobacteria bacterium]|nr:1-(5-phosphoribosyl)-5-[(5-phosphoribosylamino)methylideneamino]imidazole-4-carboxamide isomerase [Deltaproteobacteria bacterium]